MSNLTQAWTTASAALPLGWRLSLLKLEDVDREGTQHWMAAAVEYERTDHGFMAIDHRGDEHYERGYGTTPQQALEDLARNLEPRRGSTNG